MKKIRSEFLTEAEANTAMGKINPYCGNVRIIYGGINFNQGYDYYGYGGDDDFPGFSGTGAANFGGFGTFGVIGGWNFGANILDDDYSRALSRSHFGYNQSSARVTLEADVADDNLEDVRNKLYSLGAVSVTST